MEKRKKRNIILFIISYVINNLASGVLYDTYVNYLQDVSPQIATSFWAFYGYATFVAALFLLAVPKIGYKKLLMFCSLGTAAAFFCVVQNGAVSQTLLYLATVLALTGVQLHFVMLAPYVAAYTKGMGEKEIYWYTRTYYMGYIGYFAATYLGGYFVVRAFSVIAHISYGAAQEATRYITKMSAPMYQSYMSANRVVLLAVGIITLASIIPVLLIKEEKSDYQKENKEVIPFKEKLQLSGKVLLNRGARFYLLYWMLISFGMGLFTPYYTVFLNRNLHIDKATSSLMVSISYIAIVVFMFFTPRAVKKFGKVGTIVFTVIGCIPFMLMIANGQSFGSLMVPIVGFALFMRAGLANLSSPADSAVSMDVIHDTELRPIYTAIVNFASGIVSILSGLFTGKFLFTEQSGYQTAYYYAAVCYVLAAVVLWIGLRKFNKHESEGEEV